MAAAALPVIYSTGVWDYTGSIQVEFKVHVPPERPETANADVVLALETGDQQQRFGLAARPGQSLRVQQKVNNADTYVALSPDYELESDTWYVLQLQLGDTSGEHPFKLTLWKRDNPTVRRYYQLSTPAAWGDTQWRFVNWVDELNPSAVTRLRLDSFFALDTAQASAPSEDYRALQVVAENQGARSEVTFHENDDGVLFPDPLHQPRIERGGPRYW